jgi:hypothetical protein
MVNEDLQFKPQFRTLIDIINSNKNIYETNNNTYLKISLGEYNYILPVYKISKDSNGNNLTVPNKQFVPIINKVVNNSPNLNSVSNNFILGTYNIQLSSPDNYYPLYRRFFHADLWSLIPTEVVEVGTPTNQYKPTQLPVCNTYGLFPMVEERETGMFLNIQDNPNLTLRDSSIIISLKFNGGNPGETYIVNIYPIVIRTVIIQGSFDYWYSYVDNKNIYERKLEFTGDQPKIIQNLWNIPLPVDYNGDCIGFNIAGTYSVRSTSGSTTTYNYPPDIFLYHMTLRYTVESTS